MEIVNKLNCNSAVKEVTTLPCSYTFSLRLIQVSQIGYLLYSHQVRCWRPSYLVKQTIGTTPQVSVVTQETRGDVAARGVCDENYSGLEFGGGNIGGISVAIL